MGEAEALKQGHIRCVVLDFAFTLCSDFFCKVTPPECPDWFYQFQRRIWCRHSAYMNPWMSGELTRHDIARVMTQYLPMSVEKIAAAMEEGCRTLEFNPAVLAFAKEQRQQGRKMALVTANVDLFSRVVVPAHSLDHLFDVIVNSCDYHELRKDKLWPIAFRKLGPKIDFDSSFLIEDGEESPRRFRELGGQAYQYTTDTAFREWLTGGGFDVPG